MQRHRLRVRRAALFGRADDFRQPHLGQRNGDRTGIADPIGVGGQQGRSGAPGDQRRPGGSIVRSPKKVTVVAARADIAVREHHHDLPGTQRAEDVSHIFRAGREQLHALIGAQAEEVFMQARIADMLDDCDGRVAEALTYDGTRL